jgi:Predicted Zn-dependent protease (DUF2268)
MVEALKRSINTPGSKSWASRITKPEQGNAMRSSVVVVAVALSVSIANGQGARAQAPSPSPSPSAAGRWEGIARVSGAAPMRVLIALDSGASGWGGTLGVPDQMPQPMTFVSIDRHADTLTMRLPAAGQNTVLRLRLSADGARLSGEAFGQGSIVAARAGSPDVAMMLAAVNGVERSRRVADSLYRSAPGANAPTPDPDSAHLVTSDIRLFWSALDRAPADSLAPYFQRDYLEKASVGVRDFIPGRIQSAEDLAEYVQNHRAVYDSVRAANLDVASADAAIRTAFRKLKALYPPAVFPDVYFVIGRFNSGGTSTSHGLLIGAEMYRDPARLPSIVSHELVHYQQHYENKKLLEHAFMEGSADFVGELISGAQINGDKMSYGLAHEGELWTEFSAHFDDTNYFPWMYGKPNDGRPNDLGYFIGYRIAKAYYDRTQDKAQALRDIITARDGNVRELLSMSGYAPK